MPSRPTVESGWADLVFHVLAHVDVPGVPANLHDRAYVAWAHAQLGPAAARALGQDAIALAQLLLEPGAANAVQAMALLFRDVAQARRTADKELGQLGASDVARPEWLPALARAPAAAELLRCSALLESEQHGALPPPVADLPALERAAAAVASCAPRLAACELVLCRALTRHGRVFGDRLYLGAPDPAAAPATRNGRFAMQAAHEATVLEASEQARTSGLALPERGIEAIAVVVLATRTARSGLAQQHADWAEQWGARTEHFALERLPAEQRSLATRLLAR